MVTIIVPALLKHVARLRQQAEPQRGVVRVPIAPLGLLAGRQAVVLRVLLRRFQGDSDAETRLGADVDFARGVA